MRSRRFAAIRIFTIFVDALAGTALRGFPLRLKQLENCLVPAGWAVSGTTMDTGKASGDGFVERTVGSRQENGLIHGGQHGEVVGGVAEADSALTRVKALAEVLQQLAHGAAFVAAAVSVPETAAPRDVQLPLASHFEKCFFLRGSCARKEKRLVEIAQARPLRLLQGEAGILGDFFRAHLVKRYDFNTNLVSDLHESIGDFVVGPSQREAVKRFYGGGAFNAVCEIAVWNEDAAAIFGDEGMRVLYFAAKDFHFRAGLAGAENERDAAAGDLVERILSRLPGKCAMVEERAVQVGENDEV